MKSCPNKKISDGTILLIAILGGNFINFIFNAYLGRSLSFEEFGLVTLINTMWYVALIPFNALNATVNHRSAYLIAQKNTQAGLDFLKATNRKNLLIALIFSVIWLITIPLIDNFFQINDFLVPLFFTPIILLGVIASANRGFLQGNFNFKSVAVIFILDALSKLIFAWIFVGFNLKYWVYVSIPLSVLVSFILAVWFTKRKTTQTKSSGDYKFPKKFFSAALITGFSSMAFLTFDVLLAKHFLSPTEAGQYALLSLVGKMVYFFGALPSALILTFVSNDEGSNRDPKKSFYKLFSLTIILSVGAFLVLGLLGQTIVPLLFGNKTDVILQYLTTYSAAITLYAISGSIISYHLARKQYLFPILAICMTIIMSLGIIFFHQTIYQFTHVIFYTSILTFALTGILHLLEVNKLINLTSLNRSLSFPRTRESRR